MTKLQEKNLGKYRIYLSSVLEFVENPVRPPIPFGLLEAIKVQVEDVEKIFVNEMTDIENLSEEELKSLKEHEKLFTKESKVTMKILNLSLGELYGEEFKTFIKEKMET